MKILICDDHEIVRAGLKLLLHQHPGKKYIEEASDGTEAISVLEKNDFDVVLLNISFSGINALELLELIKKRWNSTNVLMLSNYTEEEDAIQAFKLGASGYLAKDAALDELFNAVKKIVAGEKYISNSVAEKIAFSLAGNSDTPIHNMLSKREYITMINLAKGESLHEIGKALSISYKTVSTYRTRIMKKMNLSKNAQLTKYCMEHKLI